ncbi:MAG: 2-C-methyl-D-erythritol 4-phosphate cytidylyltransferase [Chitinophagaceae bacterium]|nr:2-C-methyl-D-erythritol 4-phosphate cytidylyltransferase [Chitinophagaceae bacterium]
MKKFAVIVAAGLGTRMGNSIPKQFLKLAGKPVFLHSVETFLLAYPDCSIILVAHSGFVPETRAILDKAGFTRQTTVTAGGITRSDSVRAGLELVHEDGVVLVHDAARCAVSAQLIKNCCEQAIKLGSAIPVISVTDSVRRINENGSEPLNREDLRLVQTPQAFRASLLKEAYRLAAGKDFTDDAAVLEHSGIAVHLIDGETTNIKITRPIDLEIAALLKKQFKSSA